MKTIQRGGRGNGANNRRSKKKIWFEKEHALLEHICVVSMGLV